MSKKELTRLEAVQRVTGKQMRLVEAARRLSLSERQVKRLVRAFREEGAAGLVSKRRGQPSNHRFDTAFKEQRSTVCAAATRTSARRWRRSICGETASRSRARPCGNG